MSSAHAQLHGHDTVYMMIVPTMHVLNLTLSCRPGTAETLLHSQKFLHCMSKDTQPCMGPRAHHFIDRHTSHARAAPAETLAGTPGQQWGLLWLVRNVIVLRKSNLIDELFELRIVQVVFFPLWDSIELELVRKLHPSKM